MTRLLAAAVLAALPFSPLPASAQGTPAAGKTYTEKFQGPSGLLSFDMVAIPGGTFKMKVGDEEKEVTVKPFSIQKTEMTWDVFDVYAFGLDLPNVQAQIEAIEKKTRPSKPYAAPDYGYGHAGYPAISVPKASAEVFCQWLSAKTGKKYRLPTEAEWEWAARGNPQQTSPPDKPSEEELQKMAWVRENSLPEGAEEETSHPVGKKAPNGYGLHDMLGNVTEWVTTPDASADEKAITKGGSFRQKGALLHPGYVLRYSDRWQERDPQDPKSKWWLSDGPFVGFRVVCDE